MQQTYHGNPLANGAFYLVIIALLIWRYSRPQKMTVWRLWVLPAVLVVITVYDLSMTARVAALSGLPAPPAWQVSVATLVGIALGIPIGVVRGRHSEVRPTERRGTMYVHSSPLVMLVWVGAIVLRSVVRIALAGSPLATVAGDGLLALATAAIAVSCFFIWQRYTTMTATARA